MSIWLDWVVLIEIVLKNHDFKLLILMVGDVDECVVE